MNYMPPDQQAAPPEAMNGASPPPPGPMDLIVEGCGAAIKQAADQAAMSKDPEAIQRFGQGAFMFAQAIEKLIPQQPNGDPTTPSPDATLKAKTEMIKTGAAQAHDLTKLQAQHDHDQAMQKLAAEKSSAPKGKMGSNG